MPNPSEHRLEWNEPTPTQEEILEFLETPPPDRDPRHPYHDPDTSMWLETLFEHVPTVWHNRETHMGLVSTRWPNVTFTLTVENEEEPIPTREYYRNGMVQTAPGTLTFPPFDPEKLNPTGATHSEPADATETPEPADRTPDEERQTYVDWHTPEPTIQQVLLTITALRVGPPTSRRAHQEALDLCRSQLFYDQPHQWPDRQPHLLTLSAIWPQVTFQVTCQNPEDPDDTWMEYYRQGMVQHAPHHEGYAEFNPAELRDPTAPVS